jgi:hypothetical protein
LCDRLATIGLLVGLMNVLEDARDREVRRTVGTVYQFRHATPQDQLAKLANLPVPHSPRMS